MKDERNVRYHRAAGARWRPAALLLAAVLIAASLPFFGKSVFAADPEPTESCTLTVFSHQTQENLAAANVVVDIYRIADATKDQMYDTYNLTLVEALRNAGLTLPSDNETGGWDQTKKMASDLILGKGDGQTQWKPDGSYQIKDYSDIPLGQPMNVSPGIYFVVAHGNDVTDYVSQNEAGDVITLAETPECTYQFFTELVMAPTKEPDPESGEINSANPGAWDPNVKLYLKPAEEAARGDLYITKKLDEYEQRKKDTNGKKRDIIDDATFVFEVTAYKSKEDMTTVIYHEFVSMTFTEAVTKTAVVKDIPAGSYVKVEEVYSGRSYEAVIPKNSTSDNPLVQYVDIKPAVGEDATRVTFENTYDDRPGGGGSVTNHFSFDGKWDVEQVTDSSTEGKHVSNPLEERIDKSAESSK